MTRPTTNSDAPRRGVNRVRPSLTSRAAAFTLPFLMALALSLALLAPGRLAAQDATDPGAPPAEPAVESADADAPDATTADATANGSGDDTAASLSPTELARLRQDLRDRQRRISARAVAYLWDQRMDPVTGRIGKVQGRYLQALCYLALVANGSDADPVYATRLKALRDDLAQPIEAVGEAGAGGDRKVYVGTSRDVLAFETHTVVALAYQQLAARELGDLAANERYLLGADSAIDYLHDYRKRGRTYETAGGWPVNATPYNRNRPDRRTTAWILMLLKGHEYLGRDVNSTAMKEAPGFVLAAQRLAPPLTDELKAAETAYREWSPRVRRGENPPPEVRDALNAWIDYSRKLDESGGFGLDTIGIVTPSATAVGLWTLGTFAPDEESRATAAVHAWNKMPLSWDAQRFFLTQFFAVRGLYQYAAHYGTQDYVLYMNRLLTLMEQRQSGDGSFPLGSRGVEELTQMELVYTTAMCVLIVNADRGNLLIDRLPY